MSKQILHNIIWSNSYIAILWFLLGLVSPIAASRKMNAVSVETFECENVEYQSGAASVTMSWKYTPRNATPFWFKCFKGVNSSNYIAHSFVTAKTTCPGRMCNRTMLTIFTQDNWTSIKLKIERPGRSEDGLHCCKLEGEKKTMKKCLMLQVYTKPSTEMNMTSTATYDGENQFHTKPSKKMNTTSTASYNGENHGQIAWVTMALIPMGACAWIIYHWKKRKKQQGKKQRQKNDEELQRNLMV